MEIVGSWPSHQPLAEVAAWAQRVEALGFDVMHVPETIHDPFVVAAIALGATRTLTVRTSMVVAFPRSPMVTAYAAWDLAGYSGGRFQLGVASQVRGNIVGRFSTPWSEPVAQLGDYVDALRAIFASFETGTPLDHTGSHYRFDRLQPYFNPGPHGHAPTIWTGGVNRRMCVLAGERADGFVCHPTNSHPRTLRERILPAVAEGAARAGRSDGGPALVVGPQPITAPTRAELAAVREARRSELAFLYSTPAYHPQLEQFGLHDLGPALTEMVRRSDWSDLAGQLSDDVVDLLVPQGDYTELPDVLADWYAGLCDGIVLAVPEDTGHDAKLAELVAGCREIPAIRPA